MWTYRQSTGELSRGGITVGRGYSGSGEFKNSPASEAAPNHGPIPRGRYTIEPAMDSECHGPIAMRLTPDPANEMHGRGGFLIHGDSLRAPGTASEGCIIMPRPVRIAVNSDQDRILEVVA